MLDKFRTHTALARTGWPCLASLVRPGDADVSMIRTGVVKPMANPGRWASPTTAS